MSECNIKWPVGAAVTQQGEGSTVFPMQRSMRLPVEARAAGFQV